jgi:hypothetical protein
VVASLKIMAASLNREKTRKLKKGKANQASKKGKAPAQAAAKKARAATNRPAKKSAWPSRANPWNWRATLSWKRASSNRLNSMLRPEMK